MKDLKLLLILVVFCSCKKQKAIDVEYIKEGQVYNQEIILSNLLDENSKIRTGFINDMSFEKINSAYFEDNNTDKIRFNTDSVELDFTKPIEKYSPEYYTLATAYYVNEAISYYNKVFNNRINFKTQEDYRSMKVVVGDYALFTHPNQYILKENQKLSPSIFYHEVGHIAFWTLEEDLGIKFKGLSPLHVGLLEYFTVSLFDCPIVGEIVFPKPMLRNASIIHTYPQPESMKLRRTMELFKESFEDEIADTTSILSKYYTAGIKSSDKYLDKIVDNHRGGILYTSTLWRMREHIGQETTDRLVAETILSLNEFMEHRAKFYRPAKDEKIQDKLMWYDLYYGLVQKDKELNDGKNIAVIAQEFKTSNFPINKIKVANSVQNSRVRSKI